MTLPAHLVESIRSMLAADAIRIAAKIDVNRQILGPGGLGNNTLYKLYICATTSLYLKDGRLWFDASSIGPLRLIASRAVLGFRRDALSDLCDGLLEDLERMRPTEIPPILDRWRRIPEWIDLLATGSAPTLYPEWTADDWEALDLIGAEIAAWRLE